MRAFIRAMVGRHAVVAALLFAATSAAPACLVSNSPAEIAAIGEALKSAMLSDADRAKVQDLLSLALRTEGSEKERALGEAMRILGLQRILKPSPLPLRC